MRHVVVVGSLLLVVGCVGPSKSIQPVRFPLYFEELSANLDAGGRTVVKQAADYAQAHPSDEVVVIGFADPSLPKRAGMDISRTRAQVVNDELVAAGVAAGRVRQDAMGGTPFAFSRLESRRVEINLIPR